MTFACLPMRRRVAISINRLPSLPSSSIVITCSASLPSTSSFVVSEVATFSRSYVTSEQVLNNEYAKYMFQNGQCWYFLPVSSVNKQGAKKYQEQDGQHLLSSCHYLKTFKPLINRSHFCQCCHLLAPKELIIMFDRSHCQNIHS